MPDVLSLQSKKKRKSTEGEDSRKKKRKSTEGNGKSKEDIKPEKKEVVSEPEDDDKDMDQEEIQNARSGSDDSGDEEPPRVKRSKRATDADPNLPEIEINATAPAPLSKAQQRAAKKEAKLAAKSGKPLPADTVIAAGTEGAKKDKKHKKPKKVNSIWIGNLSFRTQAETLRSWIEKGLQGLADEGDEAMLKAMEGAANRVKKREARLVEKRKERKDKADETGKGEDDVEKEAESEESDDDSEDGQEGHKPSTSNLPELPPSKTWITRVNLPLKAGKGKLSDNKGFAYVDFLTPKLQRAALKLSEKMLEGRKLLIKLGDDHAPTTDARTPKPPTIVAGSLPKKQPHNASSSLFMGNLDFAATEDEIRDLVENNAIKAAQGTSIATGKKRKRADDVEEGDDQAKDAAESTDDDDDDEKDEKDEEKAVKTGQPQGSNATKSRGGQVSGLVKVRVGQFQDTGRCKGFAFLDFKTVEAATFALANRANHFMRGRKLVLQYASQSATLRSSRAKRVELEGPSEATEDAEHAADTAESSEAPRAKRPRPSDADEAGTSVLAAYSRPKGPPVEAKRFEKKDTRGRKWEVSGRPRPGAALAMAKRENVAIVEGGAKGKKITFD